MILIKLLHYKEHCTDHYNNWFTSRSRSVNENINEEQITKIIKNNAALLYNWPIDELHNLDVWLKLRGKKL